MFLVTFCTSKKLPHGVWALPPGMAADIAIQLWQKEVAPVPQNAPPLFHIAVENFPADEKIGWNKEKPPRLPWGAVLRHRSTSATGQWSLPGISL